MSELVTLEIQEGVADVRLNRPDKYNSLSIDMFRAIGEAGEQLMEQPSVRAVVLSGNGPGFCAGIDTSAFGEVNAGGGDFLKAGERVSNFFQHPCYVWRQLPVPVIAAILGRFQQTFPGSKVQFEVNQSRLLRPLIERGRIDVAVLQVDAEELRPDDHVLWDDQLVWATHRDLPFEEDVVPLVTYGENGFYRPVLEPVLEKHGIAYRYAVTSPTSAGVQAAVAAGLGVAVLAERLLTEDVVEWERGAALDPLPIAHHVVRSVPGDQAAATAVLVEAIATELTDRAPAADSW